jgi:hypothetical protein
MSVMHILIIGCYTLWFGLLDPIALLLGGIADTVVVACLWRSNSTAFARLVGLAVEIVVSWLGLLAVASPILLSKYWTVGLFAGDCLMGYFLSFPISWGIYSGVLSPLFRRYVEENKNL